MNLKVFACFGAVFVLSSLAWLATTALAIVMPPEPRVFASASGRTGLKVLPKGNKAVGICFALNEDGTERVLWRRELVNVPGDVVVLDEAGEPHRVVVTLDSHGMLGGPHALVVYDAQGNPSIDVAPTAIDPAYGNPPAGIIVSSAGRPWRTTGWSVRQPADGGGRIELNLGDGRVATIDLAAKQVTPAQRLPEKSATTQSAKP